jgi:RNA polymerase sigma-70 factor (ECF subfamily)
MSEQQHTPAAARPDLAGWVDEHGDYLYRFALARVRRPDAAEDLVQETFLAALRAADSFAGRSSPRTWLTSILKNKLIDQLRRDRGTRAAGEIDSDPGWLDGLYDRTGHLKTGPGRWGADPAELLQRREFWEALDRCRAELPQRLRQVLSLRVFDEVPAAAVCQALGISATNLGTMLYRARVRLWHCMNQKGLGPRAPGVPS